MNRRLVLSPLFLGVLALAPASAQTVGTYTTLWGWFDYQSNGGSVNYIRVNPANGYIHVVYLVSNDSAEAGGQTRGTAYAVSTDGGAMWNNFNNLRVPANRRSGFPVLDLGFSAGIEGRAIIANHSDPNPPSTANNYSFVYLEDIPAAGQFLELPRPPARGIPGQEPIWPYVAATANGRFVMAASPDVVGGSGPDFYSVFQNFSTWTSWAQYPGRNQTGGRYPVAANGTGCVGILLNVSNNSSGIYWLESTDNGTTWPASPVEIYGLSRPYAGQTYVSYVHSDVVYNGDTPLFVMTEASTNTLAPNPQILFYSQPTGYIVAVPWDPTLYIGEPIPQQRFHQWGLGWPSIGMSGSTIVVAYQVFQPEISDSAPNYHYSDVWWAKSDNGGVSWSTPQNLTHSLDMDERYPSVSKWNAPGEFNIVWQEDTQPGAHTPNSDNAVITRSYLKFMKVSTVGVAEEVTIPKSTALSQNYPNPFNPSARVDYTLSTTEHVSVKVYNALGQDVATLVDETIAPGRYTATFDATGLPSGVYICRLKAGKFTESRKMILIR